MAGVNGDPTGAEEVAALYTELRRLAAAYFRHENPGHTLQPTALVHEAFIRIAQGKPARWANRKHFFAIAARQMRRILIDHARRRSALKRKDTRIGVSLARESSPEDILTVDALLTELSSLDNRAASIAELRIFGGLKDAEIVHLLDVSISTVKRDWTFARAWLLSRLRG